MSLSPTSTQYLVGAPIYCLAITLCFARKKKTNKKHRKNRCFNFILDSLKSQNFDEILTFLGKFLRGRVLRRT